MPKNKGAGGKKFKKNKHLLDAVEVKVELKEENEAYALVLKLLGHGRVIVKFYDEELKKVRDVLAIIPGRLRKKKQWVVVNNYVLISIRSYEKDKVDIIYVYSQDQMNKLNNMEELNFLEDKEMMYAEFNDIEEDLFTGGNDEKNKEIKIRPKNITVENYGIISDDEYEEDKNENE
jgi:translation initiation factor 1A